VNSSVPFAAYISDVPAELYSLPFEFITASWVIFVQPVKFPAGSKLKALKGFSDKDVRMVFLKIEPQWDNLRSEPRFRDLMKRMRLE